MKKKYNHHGFEYLLSFKSNCIKFYNVAGMKNDQNDRLAYLENLGILTTDIVTGLQFSNLYYDYVTRPRYLKYQKALEGVEEIATEEFIPRLPLTVHGYIKILFKNQIEITC